ncbi:MAG: hypothetical protein CMA41_01960 [Euryarchaeota archaeon]|nr:hypothetical protein [Euryarchaeota archaeon]|tara:strand:- start:3745 stop:3948 length:204 start_codon:yes stop_codon:yes gene_type:complete
MSILEYDDRSIQLPLFYSSIGLMTGFTIIFPLLGIFTLPAALLIIVSILNGDISFIDEENSLILEEE